MKHIRCPICSLLTVTIMSWAAVYPAAAADTAPPPEDGAVTSSGQTQVQTRFVRDFGGFAGSDDNAQSLYSGLRNGTRITLGLPASDGGTATTVAFDVPTRPMGNGSAYISLALAKQQLANYGITDPTPEQIQAALTGGTIIPADPNAQPVELQGILVQRADGMGWGAIAKASDINLGQAVSSMRSGKTVSTTSDTTGSGVTTASGTTVQSRSGTTAGGQAAASGRGNAMNASSRGIVTAAGGPAGAGINARAGSSGGQVSGVGAGIATGNGVAASVRAGSHPGQGKGLLRQ
jgi:hypothetical protein